MRVINSYPGEFAPIHNCVNYGLLYPNDINLIAGTQASFSIDFVNGGTAADGTIIYIQGQKFEINNSATDIDGYYLKFNGLSMFDRATWLYQSLLLSLFFDPEKVYIFQTSLAGVNVLYNQVGQQSNWRFENGGISEISFTLSNGTDRIDLSNMAYVWSMYEDRYNLSLPPVKLVQDRITPLLLKYDNSTVPQTISLQEQVVDVSDLIKTQVSTTLPSIYSPIFTQLNDSTFRKFMYMRAGFRYLSGCETRNILQGVLEVTWFYNCLFQSNKIASLEGILDPYIFGYKPILIKNTYSICRNTSFFVWSLCNESLLDVVYFDANGAALETTSFTYGDSEFNLNPTYMNVGAFSNTIPANCAFYILNYFDDNGDVIHAVRFNVISCGCVAGEFIFLSDLGAYETILMDEAIRHDIPVQSEVIESALGCTVTSLIKGGRSIVNKETESVWTFEKWVDVDTEQELEFMAQFQRSQSFYMKQFINAADSYAYLKVIPENITFTPKEKGKRPKLTFTIRFNQNFKSHPQNEGIFI